MIATDKLLFLHLHKSGGTFVNALLMRCIPSAQHIGYHLPYKEAPRACRHLPVVGTVRNPWAYYVSWYHFQVTRPKPNSLFLICSDNGRLSFKETVSSLATIARDEQRLDALRRSLPDAYRKAGLNLTKSCVGELRDRGVGFYTFLYERLYAGAAAPVILRAERLRDELRCVLAEVGELPNDRVERFLAEQPNMNMSVHGQPAQYYDEDLAALIGERERRVIDRHGYCLGVGGN